METYIHERWLSTYRRGFKNFIAVIIYYYIYTFLMKHGPINKHSPMKLFRLLERGSMLRMGNGVENIRNTKKNKNSDCDTEWVLQPMWYVVRAYLNIFILLIMSGIGQILHKMWIHLTNMISFCLQNHRYILKLYVTPSSEFMIITNYLWWVYQHEIIL